MSCFPFIQFIPSLSLSHSSFLLSFLLGFQLYTDLLSNNSDALLDSLEMGKGELYKALPGGTQGSNMTVLVGEATHPSGMAQSN